jgi:hypothetical protein
MSISIKDPSHSTTSPPSGKASSTTASLLLAQDMPSPLTLRSRSTRNQRGNCTPILPTVRLYCILQLAVFVFCPFTRASRRCLVDAGIQDMMPSVFTLSLRSIRNQRCNCSPILATVRLYCILQRAVFDCRPSRTSTRPVDAGIQDFLPSVKTLRSRSIRNQRSNCSPILSAFALHPSA